MDGNDDGRANRRSLRKHAVGVVPGTWGEVMLEKFMGAVDRFYTLNHLGMVVGVLGFIAAVTPSLLPRPPLFIGVLAAVGFMVGYGVGVAAWRLWYWVLDKPPRIHDRWQTRLVLGVIAAIIIIIASVLAQIWQNEVRVLLGMEPARELGLLVILVAFVIAASLVLAVARGLRRWFVWTRAKTLRYSRLPGRLATIVGAALAVVILVLIVNGTLLQYVKSSAYARHGLRNQQTNEGVKRPLSPMRSGSPASLLAWDTLGRHGRTFTGSGPSAEDISGFTHQPALEPIRVYVSAEQAPTPAARAALAVKELERTGAFARNILIVNTTTGSGWVEPTSAAAIEYMYGGDTAQVAIQYSFLPSALAFFWARPEATESGRALYDAVFDQWQQLPAEHRPKLIVSGLSLGAYGGQSAFSSEADFAWRSDGALFLGTPGFSNPWRDFTRNRDPGSLEIKPVYRGGRIIRFATDRRDLDALLADPASHRVLYLQYPTDPITWWNTDLLWHEPDWLKEPHGEGVSPRLHWFPIITFFQISADQPFANFMPNGHGHNYAPDAVAAWAAVIPPEGWTTAKTDALQKRLDSLFTTPSG